MSSIARVIFFVDWTERIRRRTMRSCAPTTLPACRAGSASSLPDSPAGLVLVIGQGNLALDVVLFGQ